MASFALITAIAVIAAAFGYGYQDWVPAKDRIQAVHCDECGQADRRGRADRAAADSVPGETVDNEELLDPVARRLPAKKPPTWQAIIASVPRPRSGSEAQQTGQSSFSSDTSIRAP